jgi:ketosteroid isomerase-like protein
MPSVQETASEAITKLIYTYAERIDAGDFAGVAEVFAHATLTFEGFGEAVAGRDAIEALYTRTTRRYEDGTRRTKHVMTNVMVDVADDGETASGRARRTGATARHRRSLPAHVHSNRGPLGGRHHAHHDRPGR